MCSIFVRGFDFGTTEAQVKKHCSAGGKVESVELYGDGAAVVVYASAASVDKAITKLDKTTIEGNSRFIDVKQNDESKGGNKRKKADADCTVFVRGFDFGTTDDQFNDHMSQAGTIEDVKWITKGSAVVTYSSPEEASTAVETLNETTLPGNSRYMDVLAREEGPHRKKGGGKSFGKSSGGKGGKGGQAEAMIAQAMALFAQAKGMKGGGNTWGSGGKGFGGSKHVASSPGCNVFVRGFEFGTTDEQLQKHLSKAGKVADVRWVNKGSANVSFDSPKAAQKCVDKLNGTTLPGQSRYIDVLSKDD